MSFLTSIFRLKAAVALVLSWFLFAASASAEPEGEPQRLVPETATSNPVQVPPATTALGMLPPIKWEPHYRRVGWVDFAVTAVGASAVVWSRALGPDREAPQAGGIWFDEDARDALRPTSFRRRLLAEDMSDVLLGVTSSYGLFGDPLINAAWLRDSPDVGAQLFWINAEVMALTLGIQQTTANLRSRERPYGRVCGTSDLDDRTQSCRLRDRYRSFFSGHTSVPFSIAAATCVNHIYLPLSGGHAWVPCSLGFAAAAASGTLRMVSDNHYASDVMTGVAVGTTIGLTIPLIHYTTGVRPPSARVFGTDVVVLPLFNRSRNENIAGLTLSGVLK